jgi:hypothetical protein
MALSRKHYEELAKILGENNASFQLIDDIISFCKIDNRAFKPNTFVDRIKEVKSIAIDNNGFRRLTCKNASINITNDKDFFLNK